MNKNINAVVELTEKELEGVAGGVIMKPVLEPRLPSGPRPFR